jgi:hypothetical protein
MKNDKVVTNGQTGVMCMETTVACLMILSQPSSPEKQEINKKHQPMNTH